MSNVISIRPLLPGLPTPRGMAAAKLARGGLRHSSTVLITDKFQEIKAAVNQMIELAYAAHQLPVEDQEAIAALGGLRAYDVMDQLFTISYELDVAAAIKEVIDLNPNEEELIAMMSERIPTPGGPPRSS